MRFPKFLSVLLGASTASTASAGGFATSKDAVLGIEAAYSRKDLDAAV